MRQCGQRKDLRATSSHGPLFLDDVVEYFFSFNVVMMKLNISLWFNFLFLFSIPCQCWLGLGARNTWSGLGKDHVWFKTPGFVLTLVDLAAFSSATLPPSPQPPYMNFR